ncbi:MAG TPA: hypothetical protein VM764_08650 [Gemmatimonadaceae bacterium]|nr:hypothetical protein [Gemmatimonadaceae bacterium]
MDKKKKDARRGEADKNRDPLTGTPGAHPIGTGAGAAGGAATGAAIGTAVGGPVGFAVGGVAGAVVGGLAGKGVAEAINPTAAAEDEYWRANYRNRPYVTPETEYESIQPAYRYGWESRSRYQDKEWHAVENDLRSGWDKARGASTLSWEQAKQATQDAWNRLDTDNARMDDDGGTTGTRATRVGPDRRVRDRTRTSARDRAGAGGSQDMPMR